MTIDNLITESRNLEHELNESDARGYVLFKASMATQTLVELKKLINADAKREAVVT